VSYKFFLGLQGLQASIAPSRQLDSDPYNHTLCANVPNFTNKQHVLSYLPLMHIKTSCSDIIVNLAILYTYKHAILCDLSYEIVGIYF
jgi:hypothetical protein